MTLGNDSLFLRPEEASSPSLDSLNEDLSKIDCLVIDLETKKY